MTSAIEGPPRQAWAALVGAMPDPMWIVELPSRAVIAVNEPALRLLGRSRDELIGARADHLLATPEDMAFWDEVTDAPASGLDSDTVLHGPDGRAVHVRRSIRPLSADDGSAHCAVLLVDRSAQVSAEARLEESVAELQATLESTADGILVTDLVGRVRAFNRRFAEIWSIPEELLAQRQDDAVQAWMQRSVRDGAGYEQRLQTVQQATLLFATEQIELLSGQVVERVSRPLWSRGRPLGRVFSFRDLTDRLRADAQIETLTRSDGLTGLPNRARFAEQVGAEIRAMQHDGDGFALLLVDLDRFRRLNDSLGHAIGDRALRDTTERLRRCMRQGDEVARLGGDQFGMLLRHADLAAAEAAARRSPSGYTCGRSAVTRPSRWICPGDVRPIPFTTRAARRSWGRRRKPALARACPTAGPTTRTPRSSTASAST